MAKKPPAQPTFGNPIVFIKLGGVAIQVDVITKFEWKSFLNGGYEVSIEIIDHNYAYINNLNEKTNWWKEQYLRKARKEPIEVEFKIGYPGGAKKETCGGEFKKAVLTELIVEGTPRVSYVTIKAIDPPSWHLSAGKSDGKVFTGNISKVISKVVEEATGKIKSEVSETKDYNMGKWPMMRQDPYTFIFSLLEWSSKTLTNEQSAWMVGVKEDTIYIQDHIDYINRIPEEERHIANYVQDNHNGRNDIREIVTQNSTLLSIYQSRLTTQGISSVSGKFLDKQIAPESTEVHDKNTKNKINAKVDNTMAFDKPTGDNSTALGAVPEFNGGELGIKYEDWIGGRPQQSYIGSLPMIMRCVLTVQGDYNFCENEKLGASTIKLTWKKGIDDDGENDHYLHGHWIVYGFVHDYDKDDVPPWTTDLYVYRIEHDAKTKNIPGG